MRFSLDTAQQRMPWVENLSRVRFAEDLGFDGVWGFDHFQPMYGEGPGECFEAMTTLAAWGASTERVRIGALVAGLTYRHPSVFAAEAITIDHASGGRLELAYGAAWFDKEHRDLGIAFPTTRDRIDAFEEAVQIVRGLLTEDAFTFEGRHFSVRDATLRPRPRAAAAPAHLDRCDGAPHARHRGTLRRRLALVRVAGGARGEGSHPRRAGRGREPRPFDDPAVDVDLDRGRSRRRRTHDRRVAGARHDRAHLRLAERRSFGRRGVRRTVPARPLTHGVDMPQQRHMCRRLYPDGTADEGLGASGPPREQFTDFDGVTWQLVTVVDRSDTADDRQLGIYRPVSSSDPLVSGPGGPRARTLRPGSTTDRKPGWSTRVRRLLASTASRKVRDQMTRGWTLDQLLDLTEAGYEVTRIARWSLDWTFSVAYVVRDPEAARWADAGFRPTGFSAARTKGWDLARGIRETTPRKPLTPAEEFVERHRRMGYGAAALENLREISEMRHPANEAREWWVVRYDGEGAISQSHGPFTRSEAMRRASSIGECSVTRVPPG